MPPDTAGKDARRYISRRRNTDIACNFGWILPKQCLKLD
jgi:hypothetical protein